MIGKKYQYYKRILDIILSIVFMVLLLPISILIFLILILYYQHFPIFKQKRIGKNGKEFTIYKFQTMIDNAEEKLKELPIHLKKEYYNNYKLDNDPRITKIGKILRITALDEIPQFINVIKGDMSIIGPRPVVKDEIQKYNLFYTKLLSVKPGMTGWWQINCNPNMEYTERVLLDCYYADNISLKLDINIFLKTIKVIFNRIRSK